MDEEEAVKLLRAGKDGIAKWNQWLLGWQSHIFLDGADFAGVDLSGADLVHAYMRGADFTDAKLIGANLALANLSDAKLIRADLGFANLGGVDLRQAQLVQADLSGANFSESSVNPERFYPRQRYIFFGSSYSDLSCADLSDSNLRGTNFSGANLRGANLSGSNCSATGFANVNLSEVRGLDSVRHKGPSTIGLDTIFRSKGKIPDAFLRGCGVAEALIEYLPSILAATQPIQFYSCFISYCSKDQAFADRLHARLVQEKLRVWYAPEELRGGRKSIDQIDQAIRVHDTLLLVLSEASMQSRWLETELRAALRGELLDRRQIIFPIRLSSMATVRAWRCIDPDTGEDMALEVRKYHIPDFSNWKDNDSFEKAFARLLDDLKQEVDPAGRRR
jgi:uncharacterized protein YjbI with pentapeptide repeats